MKRVKTVTIKKKSRWSTTGSLLVGVMLINWVAGLGMFDAAASSPSAYRVEPLAIEVEALLNTQEDTVIPKAEIAALCGDGDGCTIRLIFDGILHSGRFFATNPDGIYWWRNTPNGSESDDYYDGSLNDLSDDSIFRITGQAIGDENIWCMFTEKTITIGSFLNSNYILRAQAGSNSSLKCKLLIGD